MQVLLRSGFTLLLLALLIPPPLSAKYPKFIEDSLKKLAHVFLQNGQCTAWPVSERMFITAAHCVEQVDEDVLMQLTNTLKVVGTVYKIDNTVDLAAVSMVFNLGTFRVAHVDGREQDQVWMMGYPGGVRQPMFYEGMIVDSQFLVGNGLFRMMVNRPMYGGMSGGPMVNESGEVVSVNQLTNEFSGYGLSTKELRMFVDGL